MKSKPSGRTFGEQQIKPLTKTLLGMTYCSDVQPKQKEKPKGTLKTAVNKIHLGKSPGKVLLIGCWFKKLTFYIEPSANLHQNTFEGSTTLPDWLTLAKTILLYIQGAFIFS